MIMEFSAAEIRMLLDDGYSPDYIGSIREGDLVAIPPVSRTPIYGDERDGDKHKVRTFTIKSIVKSDASFYEPREDLVIQNTVVNFIGVDIDGLPRHESYSSIYHCFIKRVVD